MECPHEDVGVILARIPRFHFHWSQNHFKHEPNMFRYSYADLTEREKTSYSRILEFVRSFSPLRVVTEDGNFVLDSRGNQVTVPCVIDTHSLVLSNDPMELLGRPLLLSCICRALRFHTFCLMNNLCSFVQERCLTFIP